MGLLWIPTPVICLFFEDPGKPNNNKHRNIRIVYKKVDLLQFGTKLLIKVRVYKMHRFLGCVCVGTCWYVLACVCVGTCWHVCVCVCSNPEFFSPWSSTNFLALGSSGEAEGPGWWIDSSLGSLFFPARLFDTFLAVFFLRTGISSLSEVKFCEGFKPSCTGDW